MRCVTGAAENSTKRAPCRRLKGVRKATPLAPTESPRVRTQPIDIYRLIFFRGNGLSPRSLVLHLSQHRQPTAPARLPCYRLFCENSGTSRPPRHPGGVQTPRCAGGGGSLSPALHAPLIKMYLARCGVLLLTTIPGTHTTVRSLFFLFCRLATYPGLYNVNTWRQISS